MTRPAALLLASVVAGGTMPPPRQEPAQQPPVYRAETELVEVDVIVRDREGRFVNDLGLADFEVFEDGVGQPIRAVYLAMSRALPPLGAERGGAAPAGDVRVVALRERLVVLVFDDDHLSPGAFDRLRDAARSFVTSGLAEGDRCGIVVGGTMLNNRITANREELLGSLSKAKPSREATSRALDMRDWPRFTSDAEVELIAARDRAALDAAVRRACAEEPSACVRGTDQAESAVDLKARTLMAQIAISRRRSMTTASTLATTLGRFPGRKAVVLLTEGFQLGELAGEVLRIVEQASRSGVTFYSIDAAGLGRSAGRGHDMFAPQPSDPSATGLPWNAYDTSSDATNAMALGTGGYVVRNVNDFGRALREISTDAGQYYVLGYTPSAPGGDGRFRAIKVRVKRDGVTVRARPGYLAVADATRLVAGAPAVPPESPPLSASGPGTSPVPAPEVSSPAMSPPATESLAVPPESTTGAVSEALTPAGTGAVARLRPDRANRVTALAERGRAGEVTVSEDTLAEARRGWERYEQGDVEGAEPLLGRAARDPAAPPWVAYALGQAHVALGRVAEAIVAWETVRARVPEFEPVYFDLADGYLQQRDHDAALRVLRAAEQRWPGDVEVLNAIGVIQTSRGTIDAAVDTFARAVEAAPDNAMSYFNLAKAFELRYVKSARYVARFDRWVRDEAARDKAIENYRKYLELGGPYENSARDALGRLSWKPR